jgi:hypothetical protein
VLIFASVLYFLVVLGVALDEFSIAEYGTRLRGAAAFVALLVIIAVMLPIEQGGRINRSW